MTRSHAVQLARPPHQKILEDEIPFAADERRTTDAAVYLTFNGVRGVWPSVGFDHHITCTAARTLERTVLTMLASLLLIRKGGLCYRTVTGASDVGCCAQEQTSPGRFRTSLMTRNGHLQQRRRRHRGSSVSPRGRPS